MKQILKIVDSLNTTIEPPKEHAAEIVEFPSEAVIVPPRPSNDTVITTDNPSTEQLAQRLILAHQQDLNYDAIELDMLSTKLQELLDRGIAGEDYMTVMLESKYLNGADIAPFVINGKLGWVEMQIKRKPTIPDNVTQLSQPDGDDLYKNLRATFPGEDEELMLRIYHPGLPGEGFSQKTIAYPLDGDSFFRFKGFMFNLYGSFEGDVSLRVPLKSSKKMRAEKLQNLQLEA